MNAVQCKWKITKSNHLKSKTEDRKVPTNKAGAITARGVKSLLLALFLVPVMGAIVRASEIISNPSTTVTNLLSNHGLMIDGIAVGLFVVVFLAAHIYGKIMNSDERGKELPEFDSVNGQTYHDLKPLVMQQKKYSKAYDPFMQGVAHGYRKADKNVVKDGTDLSITKSEQANHSRESKNYIKRIMRVVLVALMMQPLMVLSLVAADEQIIPPNMYLSVALVFALSGLTVYNIITTIVNYYKPSEEEKLYQRVYQDPRAQKLHRHSKRVLSVTVFYFVLTMNFVPKVIFGYAAVYILFLLTPLHNLFRYYVKQVAQQDYVEPECDYRSIPQSTLSDLSSEKNKTIASL